MHGKNLKLLGAVTTANIIRAMVYGVSCRSITVTTPRGICGGQNGLGQIFFSRYFRIPRHYLFY